MVNFVAPEIYELFSDFNNYDEAIAKLKAAYVKTPNEIFSRHTLLLRKQRPEASGYAIAATLSQQERPVAFFSRTLNRSELKHSTIEKEVAAIIEPVRKWKHYLTGRRCSLITDRKSVSYMFNTKHSGKIKNDKIMCWRIELSTYDFDIIYRCGEENIPPDALSRLNCVTMNLKKLQDLHNSLCHPGVTRLAHFVKNEIYLFPLIKCDK